MIMKPPLRAIQRAHVISATGANIEILGMTTSTLTVGKQSFKVDFLVCDKIRRPCYIGLDFLRKHKVGCEGLKPPLESFSWIDHAVIVMSNNY